MSNDTEGKSSFRDVVYKNPKSKNNKLSEDTRTDNLFNLKDLGSIDNQKFAQAASSDNEVMRTSFKIRFEVTRKGVFNKKQKNQTNPVQQ